MPIQPHQIQINLRVRLPKPHACGANDWQVTRVGADIGVRCLHCQRVLMMPRAQFERRAQLIESPPHD
jgi:hypothetical protein